MNKLKSSYSSSLKGSSLLKRNVCLFNILNIGNVNKLEKLLFPFKKHFYEKDFKPFIYCNNHCSYLFPELLKEINGNGNPDSDDLHHSFGLPGKHMVSGEICGKL